MSFFDPAPSDPLAHVEAIAAVVSAAVAIAAVVGASIVSWKVAKKQLDVTQQVAREQMELSLSVAKHQIVAPMRQKWINRLRKRIVRLNGLTSEFVRLSHIGQIKEFDTQSFIELCEEIRLLLHLGEPDHDLLVAKMGEVLRLLLDKDARARKEFYVPMNELREIAQKILKTEWEVTKKMDDFVIIHKG